MSGHIRDRRGVCTSHRCNVFLAVAALAGALGCHEGGSSENRASIGASVNSRTGQYAPSTNSAPSRPAEPATARPLELTPAPSARVIQVRDGGAASSGGAALHFKLGKVYDIGPAGPATATEAGVVMVTRDAQAVLAKREPKGVAPVALPAEAFVALQRAPGVRGQFAYFIDHGKLVRRAFDKPSELETLAPSARDASRVSVVASSAGTAVAAYLAAPDAEGTSLAMLWAEGQQPLAITPEGAGASSVALASTASGLLAVSIDGRSAMTPLHVRDVALENGKPKLGSDRVMWVGPPAQALTEVVAGSDKTGKNFAFVAMSKDALDFGLAELTLASAATDAEAEVAWRVYPNGIDLAPVAVASLCETTVLAFVRPSGREPHSPEELVLSSPGAPDEINAASARGFATVSLASTPAGPVMVYLADHRTWVAELECKK